MNSALFLLLLLLPSISFSDKLILGGVSYHYYKPVLLNEKHVAIGLEHDKWEYSVYNNSFNRTSLSLSIINRKWNLGKFKAGYRYGISTSYPTTKVKGIDGKMHKLEGVYKGVMPQAQALLSHESKYVTVDLGLSLVSTLILKVNL